MPLRKFLTASLVALSLTATFSTASARELKVGVSAGPYGDILSYAAERAAKEGLIVKVIEFSDYTLPNAALAQGDIDFNMFQHKPYLEGQIAQRGYKLVAIAPSFLVPLSVYSKKYKALSDLPDKATLAIPNDPTNGARALQLLEKGGLITLTSGVGIKATIRDIASNPKSLKIKELDAAQLPRSLEDVDAAAVTLNYAVSAGLDLHSGLLTEDATSDWGLWFVSRDENKDDPDIRRYIALFHSPEVKDYVLKKFNGSILPSW